MCRSVQTIEIASIDVKAHTNTHTAKPHLLLFMTAHETTANWDAEQREHKVRQGSWVQGNNIRSICTSLSASPRCAGPECPVVLLFWHRLHYHTATRGLLSDVIREGMKWDNKKKHWGKPLKGKVDPSQRPHTENNVFYLNHNYVRAPGAHMTKKNK